MKAPFVTIVVPVGRLQKTFGRTVRRLQTQDYDKYEIIFVVDSKVQERIKEDKRTRVVVCRKRGPAAARNLGIKTARGEIVFFTDADCIVPRDWVKRLLKEFQDGTIGVGGADPLEPQKGLINKIMVVDNLFRTPQGGRISFLDTNNCAFLKNFLEKIGGFDEKLIGCEDSDLCSRLTRKFGKRLKFVPSIKVVHLKRYSLRKFFGEALFYGKWHMKLFLKGESASEHPGWLFLLQTLLWFLLMAAVVVPWVFFPAVAALVATQAPELIFFGRREKSFGFLVVSFLLLTFRGLFWALGGVWGFFP